MKVVGGVVKLTCHQFANNWMTVDGPNFENKVVSPERMQLTEPEEFERFRASKARYDAGDRTDGQFLDLYELTDDGRFKPRRPQWQA